MKTLIKKEELQRKEYYWYQNDIRSFLENNNFEDDCIESVMQYADHALLLVKSNGEGYVSIEDGTGHETDYFELENINLKEKYEEFNQND